MKSQVQKSPCDTQVGGSHYTSLLLQPWEIVSVNSLDYWEGNMLKYLLRHRGKGGRQDLEKMRHYLDYTIENYNFIYGKDGTNVHPGKEEFFSGISASDFSILQPSTPSPTEDVSCDGVCGPEKSCECPRC